jgi:hypothetical protein
MLTVNTQESCATIVRPLRDIEVTPGQTAIFRVETRGYPLPSFRWQFNGKDISGATSDAYSVANVNEIRIGLYTVYVTNPLCATNVSARLSVAPASNLVITEAMASPTNKVVWNHDTWWELTNAGTNVVNLRGYRWDDNPASWEASVVVTNDVILLPGRSAIFVSTMTPLAFRRWWGEKNLPTGLPIISHYGNGLAEYGDLIQIWNATAQPDDKWLLSKSLVNLEAGISLWFDPVLARTGSPSVEGEQGAFRANEAGDIGSPGWTSNEQRASRLWVTSIRRETSGISVTWTTLPGRVYELRYWTGLDGSDGSLIVRLPATGNILTALDTSAGAATQRFYRVILLP